MTDQCPVCHKENRPDVKFCAFCGTTMAPIRACPVCAKQSTSTQFCTFCGHRFGEDIKLARPVPAEAAIPTPTVSMPPSSPMVPAHTPTISPLSKAIKGVDVAAAHDPVASPPSAFLTNKAITPNESDAEETPKGIARSVVASPTREHLPRSAPKANIAYMMALVALAVAGGGYWFMSHRGASPVASGTTTDAPSAQTIPHPIAQSTDVQTAPVKENQATAVGVNPAVTPASALVVPQTPVASPMPSPNTSAIPAHASVAPMPPKGAKAIQEKKVHEATAKPSHKPPLVSASPSPESASAKTRSAGKAIDDIYNDRVAAECSSGLTGIVCRETVRLSLCKDKWSENPPPGQSRCKNASQPSNY